MPLTIKKWITTKLFGTVANDYNDNLDAIKAFVDGLEATVDGKEATLNTDQKRKITISTSNPSGGANGDIWIKV